MTVDAVRGTSRRRRSAEGGEALAIGEADANIFDCPSCARPLAVGSHRCPGCGTRILAGVRATTASGFLAAGLIVGLLVGAGATAAALLVTRPADGAATDPITAPSIAPAVSAAPNATAPVASAPAPVVDPAIPASAVSALRQSVLVDQRLLDDGARLSASLAVRNPVAVDIARALRAIGASAAFGDRIAPDVADWSAASAVSSSLTEFYAAVGATAREGLTASLTNTRAYVAAGTSMLEVLAALPGIDAAKRDLAASVDLELPALTDPAGGGAAPAP